MICLITAFQTQFSGTLNTLIYISEDMRKNSMNQLPILLPTFCGASVACPKDLFGQSGLCSVDPDLELACTVQSYGHIICRH